MRPIATLERLIAWALVTTWSLGAAASTTFPAQVDQHLKLTGKATVEMAIAPPDGCLLCHVNETGGVGTNNAFGGELRQHGALAAQPATVGPALDALEVTDPHAIDDIVMGINPNNDHSSPTGALPQPSYGCSAGGGSRSRRIGWPAAPLGLAAAGVLVAGALRKRRSQELPPGRARHE